MTEDYSALTEREKETLRLLLAGHEAKSIARELDLSVHTVNDRLRNARAKLGVTSSREAARRLAEIEDDPQFLGSPNSLGGSPQITGQTIGDTPETVAHSDFGVAPTPAAPPQDDQFKRRQRKGQSLVWLAGGMIIMSLVIAAFALSSIFGTTGTADGAATIAQGADAPAETATESATESEGVSAARSWLALVDSSQWAQSWEEAGSMFRAQVDAPTWQSMVQPVREPLGALVSRQLDNVNATSALPGVPKGEYEVIQFRTQFENMGSTIETVTMVKEADGWAAVGYYIKPA